MASPTLLDQLSHVITQYKDALSVIVPIITGGGGYLAGHWKRRLEITKLQREVCSLKEHHEGIDDCLTRIHKGVKDLHTALSNAYSALQNADGSSKTQLERALESVRRFAGTWEQRSEIKEATTNLKFLTANAKIAIFEALRRKIDAFYDLLTTQECLIPSMQEELQRLASAEDISQAHDKISPGLLQDVHNLFRIVRSLDDAVATLVGQLRGLLPDGLDAIRKEFQGKDSLE